jgi:hypothetical protein
LKAPGINIFKPKHGKPLSTFAFNSNLRRFNPVTPASGQGRDVQVGRFQPLLKATMVSAIETIS